MTYEELEEVFRDNSIIVNFETEYIEYKLGGLKEFLLKQEERRQEEKELAEELEYELSLLEEEALLEQQVIEEAREEALWQWKEQQTELLTMLSYEVIQSNKTLEEVRQIQFDSAWFTPIVIIACFGFTLFWQKVTDWR